MEIRKWYGRQTDGLTDRLTGVGPVGARDTCVSKNIAIFVRYGICPGVLEISPRVGNGVNHGKSGSRTYLVGNVVRNKFGHGEWCQSLPYDHNV